MFRALSIIVPLIACLYLFFSPYRHFATVAPPAYSDRQGAIYLPSDPIMSSPFPPCPPIPSADGPVELILPPTEDRPHRYLTLPNGLEVILVSDVKADKAAASMDVGAGHLNDPDNLPGCAHFCEHLLFMGTKKYPQENAYQQYLNSHNGHSNAYTAMTSTVYFFDVAANSLEGALDRFAGFFIEPLFNEDCTEREILAVDSEHKKNLQNDVWRFFQLEKHILREDHPYHKFGTGSHETLWSKPKDSGRDPRQELIDWWEKFYCARRMKLAVVGMEDLDTLEKWVRERFEQVPVKSEGAALVGPEGVRVAFEDSPLGEKEMKTITFTKPVQDARGLEITFPFPDLDHLYQSKPSQYIGHFLGHEGPGSMLSYLKRKGWCNYLRAGASHGAAGFDFIKITVDLTPTGLEHWQDVTLVIFKYIALLRSEPPSSTTFQELKAISDISFRFQEKGKTIHYAMGLSNSMQIPVPREKIISGKALLEEFRADELAAALQLLDPRRAVIGITAKEVPQGVESTYNMTEPVYGTEYAQVKFSEELLKEAMTGAPIPELALAGKNPFVPERLDVEKFDVKDPAMRPTMLRNEPGSRLWYKRDDRFWLPKSNVNILLHSPIIVNTPRNAVLSTLWCDLFRDSITEDIYDADLAGLGFSVSRSHGAVSVGAAGFNDKLAVLLETMLKKMVGFEVDEARYPGVVDDLELSLKNFPLSEPYDQAAQWTHYATEAVAWTPEEKLKELQVITLEQVRSYGKELLQRLFVESLFHGNTTVAEANEIQDMVERVIQSRPLTETEKNTQRSLMLPPSSEHVWKMDLPNKDESNSAVIYTVQVGDSADQPLRATLSLFAQIADEPSFAQLRTKEQLGYICGSRATHSTRSQGFRVVVQSEKDPVYVETRIEAFFDFMKTHIEEMSDEEFEKHKQALISKREETVKNLGEETQRFFGAIGDRTYEFGKRATDVINLKKTTKDNVMKLFMSSIHPSSPTRSKLSVYMKSQFKGVTFDVTSAQPLLDGLAKHGIAIDQETIQSLLSSNPTLAQVKEVAAQAIEAASEAGVDEGAIKELESLAEALKEKQVGEKTQAELEAKLRPNNVYIDNIYEFKANMTPSKAAVPLEPWEP